MTNRGKKIQCTACGLKYYDLGQKDKSCPKCKNIPISSSKSKFKKKNNDKENSVKLELDFFYINDEKINQFLSVLNNKIKIDTSLFWLRGWYALKQNYKEIINPDDPNIVFLKTSPTDGLKNLLSNNNFLGIGQVTVSGIIDRNPDDIMLILSQDKLEIIKRLNVSESIATSLHEGWKKNKKEILSEIFFRELSFSTTQIKKIHDQHKNEILSILSKKPVEILGKLPRVSFKQIESIYDRLFKTFTDQKILRYYHDLEGSNPLQHFDYILKCRNQD